ncbi:hypothetical protein FQ187_03225 [Pseudomonas sp. ANT_J28]|nr:hypothetical protein FQ187_03225 [Pseudomonas sp. ANT_J28]
MGQGAEGWFHRGKSAWFLWVHSVYISISAVTATAGFALTATPFGKRPKGSKGLAPSVRPLA